MNQPMTNNDHKPGATERRRMSVEEEYWSRKFGVAPEQMKARQNDERAAADQRAVEAKKS